MPDSILDPGHCDTCRFWGGERAHDLGMPLDTCRCGPPKLTRHQVLAYHDPDRLDEPGPLIDRGVWPWTAFDDWCGCYCARKALVEE